jgi:hypothetical protein
VSKRSAGLELSDLVRDRKVEIRESILSRLRSVEDGRRVGSAEYDRGLSTAVETAIEYAVEAIEEGERGDRPIPAALLVRARLAAQNSVSIDTLLRRYFLGMALFNGFVMQAAVQAEIPEADLYPLLRIQTLRFDRAIVAVGDEYRKESTNVPPSEQKRLRARIQAALNGEVWAAESISYDFDLDHVAVIMRGPSSRERLRDAASTLDAQFLHGGSVEGTTWAWFGRVERHGRSDVRRALELQTAGNSAIALGGPAGGVTGWRLAHRQALAAYPIAQESRERVVWYSDVGLVSAALRDDLLERLLREEYLKPLEAGKDDGAVFRTTLQAFFAAGLQVTATASALSVSRNTVSSRLRAVEDHLQRPLSSCLVELACAMRLDELVR